MYFHKKRFGSSSSTARRGSYKPSFRRGSRPRPDSGVAYTYIQRATAKQQINTEPVPQSMEVKDLRLDGRLMRSILGHGYTRLTPIQEKAIPAIMEGKDVIGIANTGTGKTAAFLIPLIEKIIHNPSYKALIITPTRELALQINDELRRLANGVPVRSAFCIGQSSMRNQINELRNRPHIVVGTPGRLKDFINRRFLRLESFGMIVLDEADQMLDMGFIHDIKEIISFLPKDRQSLFFSATLSPEINRLIQSFVVNPVTVSVKKTETTSHIRQDIVKVKFGMKSQMLHDLLQGEAFKKVLIFGRTKMGVERLSRTLYQKGVSAVSIHGDKPQHQRQKAIRMFKEDAVRVLVATDVAARGIDIANVSHVINYDVPATYEDYIHRIGRTGRADSQGVALTFVDSES